MHVFIKEGLQYFLDLNKVEKNEAIHILEVGFGTGLNALLSLNEAIHLNQKISYEAVEPYPISTEEVKQLNYVSQINPSLETCFMQLHRCKWNEAVSIHQLFVFKKMKMTLEQFNSKEKFHIIYFDAFDPNTQPELWTEAIFKKLNQLLFSNGILVTYCSKSIVRKAMMAAGFSVTKIKGPPGKREIIRAIKQQVL